MTNQFLLVAIASLMLTSGCATTGPTPEQVGVGRYLHLRTPSKLLLAQHTHTTPVNCELNLRNSWSHFLKSNFIPECSSIDLSAQLPYRLIIVKSDFIKIPLSIHFESSELCEVVRKETEGGGAEYGNVTYENHCAGISSNNSK